MEAAGEASLGATGLQRFADICFFPIERIELFSRSAAFRTTDMFAFGFEPC